MATSQVALLGILRELHTVLPQYDWKRLEEIVASRKPDLLCVEIDRQDWEADALEKVPVESREALVRLARHSEITLVPIGGGGRLWEESGLAVPSQGRLVGLRRPLFRLLGRLTTGLMQMAGSPRAVNSPVVEHLCGSLCKAQSLLADREVRRAWTAKNEELLEGILWTLRHDPGRRVLIALDCRRKHWLRRRLRSISEVRVVDFWKF